MLGVLLGFFNPFTKDVLVNIQIYSRLRYWYTTVRDQFDRFKLELPSESSSCNH
jgi:hypothetical protein